MGFGSIIQVKIDPCVSFSIHKAINVIVNFALELDYIIQYAFFWRDDVLVLDNAELHTGRDNAVVQD